MCLTDALADDLVEKTIRTYRKLVKAGVQPEKPVPFFSTFNERFRRNTETQDHAVERKLVKQKKDAVPLKISAHDLDLFSTAEGGQRYKREIIGKTEGNLITFILFDYIYMYI